MSVSMSLKDKISSPLEAGASIADGYQLPSRLTTALEYASKRLQRKTTKITLLVVQRDHQLLTSPLPSPGPLSALASPLSMPGSAAASAASTPARSTFGTSTISSFKQFIRSNSSVEPPIRERIVHVGLDHLRNGTASPAFSDISMSSASTVSTTSTSDSTFSRQLRWPNSPMYSPAPLTPATPFTIASSTTDTGSAISGAAMHYSDSFGAKIVYVGLLGPREEKILNQTIEKTSRKFRIGSDWLPNAVSPATLGLSADVVNRSVAQNEVLFSSENLNVLSLDHLYTFRTALQSYARTQDSCRLEDAVDELRRLILANGRRKLRKSTLVNTYRWLDPVSETALADVCRMYSRAYGGLEGESGVENDVDPIPAWPLPNVEPQQPLQAGVMVGNRTPISQLIEETRPSEEEDEASTPPSSVYGTPQQSRGSTPSFDRQWSLSEEKELFGGSLSLELDDDELEIDAIEAWYRHVQLQPVDTHVEQPPPPQPVEPPPPPPVIEVVRTVTPPPTSVLEESRHNTTPKISPPPLGRNLALRLQTTFDKPKPKPMGLRQLQTTQPPHHQPQPQPQPGVIPLYRDDEEDLETARPISAIAPPSAVRWTTMSMSIDNVMFNGSNSNLIAPAGGRRSFGTDALTSPVSPSQHHMGPATPNGYEDISPITRGEWGFLMVSGLPKTAAVEMC